MIGKFLETEPVIAATCFVAPGARLIGAVEIGAGSSVWYNVVIRADINEIKIGAHTNIQDGAVLHVADEAGVCIGDYVTVGHGAIIHACRVKDKALIGMGAIIQNGAEIGQGAVVAAGALVPENFKVPDHTLALGIPARVIRELTAEEKQANVYWAEKYSRLAQEYVEVRKHEPR